MRCNHTNHSLQTAMHFHWFILENWIILFSRPRADFSCGLSLKTCKWLSVTHWQQTSKQWNTLGGQVMIRILTQGSWAPFSCKADFSLHIINSTSKYNKLADMGEAVWSQHLFVIIHQKLVYKLVFQITIITVSQYHSTFARGFNTS